MSFQKINNQPGLIAALKSTLEKKRLPHALLFQGPEGSGQRSVAAELAKAVFCENKNGLESCDTCYHCRQVDKNSHPDYFVLELSKDSRELKVEEIRDLISRANFKPFSAQAKVFVIDPADRMNPIAQNAFLKTLEEPLGRTVFILISQNPQQLLPTIRSRVQTLHFVPTGAWEEQSTSEQSLEKSVLEYVLYYSDQPLKAPDLSKLNRQKLSELMDRLIEFYRDLLVMGIGLPEMACQANDRLEKGKLSRHFDEEMLEDQIEFFGEIKEKINENLNVKLILSYLWDSLAAQAVKVSA